MSAFKSINEALKKVYESAETTQVDDLPEDATSIGEVFFDFISRENQKRGETVDVSAEIYKSSQGLFAAFNLNYTETNVGSDGYLKLSVTDPSRAQLALRNYLESFAESEDSEGGSFSDYLETIAMDELGTEGVPLEELTDDLLMQAEEDGYTVDRETDYAIAMDWIESNLGDREDEY